MEQDDKFKFVELRKLEFRGRYYTNETGRFINWNRLGSICWIYNICCTFHSFDFWTWKLVKFPDIIQLQKKKRQNIMKKKNYAEQWELECRL